MKRLLPPAVLLLAHLALTAVLSSGWCFGKYPHLADLVWSGEATAAQVGDASPAYLVLHLVLSALVIRWLQAVIAAACAAVLFEALRRSAGNVAAWVGGLCLALGQPWLVYSAVMEPDLLIGASTLGALLLLERKPHRLLTAAALVGVAISLRPTALVLLGLLVAWLAWKRTSWGQLTGFVVAALLVSAAPSLVLRTMAHQDLRGTMSAGQVFHQSHRPESVGFGATFPSLLKIVEAQAAIGPHPPDHAHELYRELARVDAATALTDAQAEQHWLGKSLRFMRDEPVEAVSQLASKVVFFIAPPSTEYDVPAVQRLLVNSALALPLRLLTLLGCGALLVLLATRRDSVFGLHWLAALVVALGFYAHGRYLVGLVPTLCVLVGLGAAELSSSRRPALLVLAALPIALLALPQVRWSDRLVERLGALDVSAGTAVSWEAARQGYLEEQAAAPDVLWPTSPHGAGVGADDLQTLRASAQLAEARFGTQSSVDATLAASLWAAAGDCDQALPLAARAAESGFHWALGDAAIDPRLIASDCLLATGHRPEAVARLEEATRAAPRRLEVLARLIAAGDVGEKTDVPRWERELFESHDAASAHYALARARRRWGDPEGAALDARWLLAHFPPSAPFAEHELALAMLDLGQNAEARVHLLRTLGLRSSMHEERRLDVLMNEPPAGEEEARQALAWWRRRGHRAEVQQILATYPSLRR